jgi:formate/nitrite transporter FocA (FNT family)
MGIILTTLAGADVFMGNALISMPVLSGEVKLSKFLKTHALVFVGNFIGAFLIASLTAASGVLGGGIAESVISTAVAKAELAPYQSIIRGMLCNMLVTLGVWSAVVAKSAAGKFMALYFPIVVFVSAGFENAITNVYFLTSGAFASAMYNGSSELGVILLGFAKFFHLTGLLHCNISAIKGVHIRHYIIFVTATDSHALLGRIQILPRCRVLILSVQRPNDMVAETQLFKI